MHNYKLGDKVYHHCDAAPFIVVGIRENEVEIKGDWSGGTHNIDEADWVNLESIEMYDDNKPTYYFNGNPYKKKECFKRLKGALSLCHDIIRDIDIYEDTHMEHSRIKECVKIASDGLDKLYKEYPDLFNIEPNPERSVATEAQSGNKS